jgi:hypothetical protein
MVLFATSYSGASMVKKFFTALNQPLGRVGLLIVLLIFLSGAVWGIHQTQTSPEQPIQFPHKRHIDNGVQCLYCHPGALRGPSPGLPTETKCWGCHQQMEITKRSKLLQPLVHAVENNEPIQWVPVAQVPDFVHFVHRPHIAAGLNCETCHGDVSKMTIYENPQVMNMGWCLKCHKQKAADNPELYTKLTDCSTCHY